MCGYFWHIKTSFFGQVTGDKIWVVLHNGVLYTYESAFETTLLRTIECKDIVDVTEKVFDKIEMKVPELTLKCRNGEGI